jgi:hypothetical protein
MYNFICESLLVIVNRHYRKLQCCGIIRPLALKVLCTKSQRFGIGFISVIRSVWERIWSRVARYRQLITITGVNVSLFFHTWLTVTDPSHSHAHMMTETDPVSKTLEVAVVHTPKMELVFLRNVGSHLPGGITTQKTLLWIAVIHLRQKDSEAVVCVAEKRI